MIIDSRLPRFLLDMLHACPRHGDGVHNWLFRCARHLHAHRTESEIFSLLKIHCSDCGRLVPDGEIHEAVSNSRSCAWAHERSSAVERKPRSRKWPRVKQDKAQSIINKGPSLAELWELSPIRLGTGTATLKRLWVSCSRATHCCVSGYLPGGFALGGSQCS